MGKEEEAVGEGDGDRRARGKVISSQVSVNCSVGRGLLTPELTWTPLKGPAVAAEADLQLGRW